MIKWCVEHKLIVTMLAILLVAGGVISYVGLERQENPSFAGPVATIQCIYPGASPEDVEKQIIVPIEKELTEITEIKTLKCYAMDSVGIISVTLHDMADADIPAVWDEVKGKVDDAKSSFPEQVEEPVIDTDLVRSYGVVIGLSSKDYTYVDLEGVAEKLRAKIGKIDGVAAVDLSGNVSEEIHIDLDMVMLNQYGISPAQIGQALAARNINIPGGNLELENGKIPVQITGEYESYDEIQNTIVGVSRETGLPVFLGNVASLEKGTSNADTVAGVNGDKAVLVCVRYAEKQNVMEVGREIEKVVDAFRNEELYAEMEMTVITDQAEFVDQSLSLFLGNLLSAIVLVVLVVWLAMGARSAAVVSLPIALVTASMLICMKFMEIPMHQVSIASLVISLSLLVANGIIANDNMYLYMQQGRERVDACVKGVSDVKIPILTSTLTTIASFLPLMMMQGAAGKFAYSLPLLVSVALIASCLMAMTVVPAFGEKILKVKDRNSGTLGRFEKKFHLDALLKRINSWYEALLEKSLSKPKKTILIFVGLLLVCLAIVPTLGMQVFPPIERDQYVLEMQMPQADTTEMTQAAAQEVSEILKNEDTIQNFAYTVGDGFTKYYVTFSPAQQGSNVAEFLINGDRNEAERIARSIEQHLPNAAVHAKYLEINMPQEYPIQIRISGEDLDVLQATAEDVKAKVAGVEGAWNAETDYGSPSWKLMVQVNEEKSNLVGITNYDVASTVRMAVNGSEVSKLKQSDLSKDEIPIIMRIGKTDMNSAESLNGIFLTSQITGENIPLAQIANLETERSLNKIVRRNESRTITVGVFVNKDASPSEVLGRCQDVLSDYELPDGYTLEYGGENEFSEETFGSMIMPAIFAVVLIYMIMALQFGNLLEPLIIMGTIPLSFIGIILGLRIMGYPIGFMALLGAISLMGVVVNNGIVLLDYIKNTEAQNENILDVIRTACKVRIRPIMIGMITTVISLMPLMISGGALWAPLAASIVFGMLVSTVLTLIVIPCGYLTVYRARNKRVHA